jgi:glycerophosphoryl diester phosphodiesterase
MKSPLPGSPAAGLPYFAPPLPRVFAHRGLAVGVPENTLLAFLRALAAGAGYLELDVHASSDGVAVVSHDPDLLRLAGRAERIDQLTLAQLRQVELGEGQHYCSLREVLDAFPAARFNIDIKADAAVKPTVVAIRLAGAKKRVLVTSFSERRRAAAVRHLPGVATSASAVRVAVAVVAGKLGLVGVMRRTLRGIHAVQVPVGSAGLTIATRRMIQRFHSVGVEIHIWTVNDRATMERLLDLGVDGLVTDVSETAVRLVEHRASQSP